MKTLDYSKVEAHITAWLNEYIKKTNAKAFIIGVSGGVDSAVVSTLAAKTGLPLFTMQMPIRQRADEVNRATSHIIWLMENYPNVQTINSDLTATFDAFLNGVEKTDVKELQHMAEANTRSRLRMVDLYYHAAIKNCLVLGTGNKVEDFGIGFFSKYGDGGIDLSPIGDLMKSEVRALGKYMGVNLEIINAIPSDGLFDDGRGDEDQIGASYDELEWAMDYIAEGKYVELTPRQKTVIEIYTQRHKANQHKMNPIPVCSMVSLREE